MTSGFVDEFVARLTWRYRLRRVAAESFAVILAAALVVASVAIAAPGLVRSVGLVVFASVTLLLGIRCRVLRFDVRRADRLLGLGGALQTWNDLAPTAKGDAMAAWFERDLGGRLRSLPDGGTAAVRRRPGRIVRHAFVLLVVAILLQWLWLPQLPDGVLELAGRDAPSLATATPPPSRPAPGDDVARGGSPPPEVPDEGDPDAPPDEVPPAGGQDPRGDEGPELPPEALRDDLAVRDAHVVPSFVGAGAGHEREVLAAGLDEQAVAPQRAPTSGAAGAGAAPPGPDAALPTPEFERALEHALESRHVRDEERAFVQGWFRSLLDERR